MKRTFQPKKRHRATKHGFLTRSKSSHGRKVLAAAAQGRAKLAAWRRRRSAAFRAGVSAGPRKCVCVPTGMRKRKRRALRRRRGKATGRWPFAATMK